MVGGVHGRGSALCHIPFGLFLFFLFPFLFFLLQTCHLPLPSVSSDLSLLCTTWNFAKFHTFLSVYLSPHSDRHSLDLTKPYGERFLLNKKFEKSKPGITPDHTAPAYSGIRRQTSLFKCNSENSQGHISETRRWIFIFKRWKCR